MTPTSQIIGAQAVLNVLVGKYKLIPKEVKDYIRGLYGRPPAPISKELLELTKEEVIRVRPADLLPPMWENIRSELPKDLVEKEEDYLSYALLPNVAIEFMQRRKNALTRRQKLFSGAFHWRLDFFAGGVGESTLSMSGIGTANLVEDH